MQGRRTLMITAAVALVALLAASSVAGMHVHADTQRKRYEMLIDLEADANRVDALESDANAERRVPLAAQAEVVALLDDMHEQLAELTAEGSAGVDPVLRLFDSFRPQIREEFALMRSRDFERAGVIDARVNFERVRHGVRRAADRNRALADRLDRISWIGTGIVAAFAAIALTALLVLLDRAARRQGREGELRRLAFEDSFTGLPSRADFEEQIAATLAAGTPAVVAFLDLDDFKQVNDSLGHPSGDRLLSICGERLRNALRADDTVARLGGDEFAALAGNAGEPEGLLEPRVDVASASTSPPSGRSARATPRCSSSGCAPCSRRLSCSRASACTCAPRSASPRP